MRGSTGTKTLLVVRIEAQDASTTSSELVLSDKIFGSGSDQHNLKSQYAKCSYNELVFEKATDAGGLINNGVYTLNLPDTVISGVDNGIIRTAALDQGAVEFDKSLEHVADYTMLCLPPGTTGGWIAYAYVNWFLSVYNDQWCTYPSAQLHEIGKLKSIRQHMNPVTHIVANQHLTLMF